MPDFQFTPILTVKTDDQGILVALDWDWSDSGQGQWNPVTVEHEATAAHEAVCAALDKVPDRWLPEHYHLIGERVHEPITPVTELVNTVTAIAAKYQAEADKVARANNPSIVPEQVSGHSREAHMLREIAGQIRELVPASLADKVEGLGWPSVADDLREGVPPETVIERLREIGHDAETDYALIQLLEKGD